jgi:7-cyano-7-deazaguanine reductase
MDEIPLGKPTPFTDGYDRGLLARIERAPVRQHIGIRGPVPFAGVDVWNGYEFSWLDQRGRPCVAGLRLQVGADSPCIVESKSMKLYLNGFAQTRFESPQAVHDVLAADLGAAFGAPVAVALLPLEEFGRVSMLPGECLDGLEVAADVYERTPDLLTLEGARASAVAGASAAAGASAVDAALHTHLFRSLCPVTSQPDWASVLIRYRGPAIDRGSLLRYLVSFRRHQAFHETTVEQIWLDLKERCRCERLLVAGYFLRRGGLDINPFRADDECDWPVLRLARQ